MLKHLAVISLFVSSTALADTVVQELYMPNDAGGYVTLTMDECKLGDRVKKDYPFRTYATEDEEGKIKHEGCWIRPSTDDAPKVQGMTIIPLVNTYWEGGDRATFQASQFGPIKQRWDFKLPPMEVKPEHIPNSI